MTTEGYAQWLVRGRGHQAEHRPVDAMLCYRRALRENAHGADAHFHLGEVLWQLGRLNDAIAAWRSAVSVFPEGPAANLALAEATLAFGDAAAAIAPATRAVELSTRAARALLILGTAQLRVMEGERTTGGNSTSEASAMETGVAQQSMAMIIEALEREPVLLHVPSLAGPLALMIDRVRDSRLRRSLIEVIAQLAQRNDLAIALPALLLAIVAESAEELSGIRPGRLSSIDHHEDIASADGRERVAIHWDAAVLRPYGASEHDALRRLALAALRAAHDSAAALGQRYAELCKEAFSTSVPLAWPLRTPGALLRVVVLVNAREASEQVRKLNQVIGARVWARCDITLAIIGNPVSARASAGDAGNTVTLDVARDFSYDAAFSIRSIALTELPGAAESRQLATLDPDLLLDLIGLTAPVGPLLAQRPARAIITLQDGVAPISSPLVDAVLANISELPKMLSGRAESIDRSSKGPATLELAALFNDAVRAQQNGDSVEAAQGYDEVLRAQPGYAPALLLRGTLSRDQGDLSAALVNLVAATQAAPLYLDARVAAAQAALDNGQPDLAIALAENHLANAPGFAALWRAVGLAHLARGEGEAAAEVLAHALNFDMTDGQTHYNHGVALQMQHRFADAARAYQRALAFRPDLIAADFNLGVLFQEQGNGDAAIAAYTQVLRDDPRHASAYRNLGEVLFAAGKLEAWKANFDRFEAHCPRSLLLAVQALEVCQHWADFGRLEHYLDGLRGERFAADNDAELAQALEELQYLLMFFDIEPDILHRLARTYDATTSSVYGKPLPLSTERRPGRVRLGYVSADLRNHVMGKMIWQAVQHHDRMRFELFFYSLSTIEDSWTDEFKRIADQFIVIANLSERESAVRIAADDIDLLIDLSTHTKGAKPGILAMKPARVQVTHVASAGVVGLSTVDFKLTDRFSDVPANQEHMIETLLPMEGCVYPYRHVPPAPDHLFHRQRLGIMADAVVIGAFNAPLKLSRRCLRLWAEVMQRIPRARLAISPINPALRGSFTRLLSSVGIAPERLLMIPQGRNDSENQARYTLVDFVLDPMPFGGVNGTLEALDMGVPVVTLCGRRHGERTSYSILANLGVLETVAMSGPEYIDLAVRLASDPAFMNEVRGKINGGLAHSPLTDMKSHTRNLEVAYVNALALRFPAAVNAPARA